MVYSSVRQNACMCAHNSLLRATAGHDVKSSCRLVIKQLPNRVAVRDGRIYFVLRHSLNQPYSNTIIIKLINNTESDKGNGKHKASKRGKQKERKNGGETRIQLLRLFIVDKQSVIQSFGFDCYSKTIRRWVESEAIASVMKTVFCIFLDN